MSESLLNRILRDNRQRRRMLALVLCLSMVVSLGTFAGFHKNAIAKVYTREVLDCPYAHEGAEPVAHVHNDDCYEGETLVCPLPEREAHVHDESCYQEIRTPVCGLEESEGHQHSEECFDEDGVLTCTVEAGEGAHTHSDACFETEYVLNCSEPELPVHVHDAGCFHTEEITVDEAEEASEPEQAGNTVPEMPVSDPYADLETAEDWERDFENFELSGNWARDLVHVAATQQGHGESLNNFEAILNDAGDAWVRHGYTRYGAWYGYPYAEWSAMFVSFCLRYAGIPAENVPNNPTAAFMAESFSMGELFAGRDYIPAVGDLVFFDTAVDDEIENIDHMGIVYYVDAENGIINTVEGDRTDVVTTFGYYMNDKQIVGYGILPQNPYFVPTEGENEDEETGGFIVMTMEEEVTDEKTTDEQTAEEKTTDTNEETTDTAEATAPAVPMPAQSWERTAGGIKVSVEAPEGAFPENTRIAVTPVNGSSLVDTVSNAVDGAVLEVQAVDITFFNEEGQEIEPAVPIRVSMTPAETEYAEEKANVVHVDIAQQTAELIEQAGGTETDNTEVVFDAEAFTIYAIVYTYHVDFEYEVDGKVYTSSMPGAEDIPLDEIVKGLSIVDETELETFLSKIASVTSTNEEVAVVTEDRSVRVLKDGDAQIVITMQDGAQFKLDVKAEGETSIETENVAISTVNDLYLPEKAEAKAEVVDGEEAIAAVQRETGEETEYTVFDISLENVTAEDYKEGFEVEVALESNINGKNFRLYHVHDGETTDITESLKLEGPVDENGVHNVSGFSFHTDGFSEFVLSYTVDFHWEVNGKVYEFSIPGGGFISLEHIAEALGLGTDTKEYTEAELADASDADNAEATEDADVAEDGAVAYDEAIQLNELEISEVTKQFVADVVSVEFSSPELVWVGKINEAATIGGLKEANGLEVEYSADMTEEQIAEINAQTVETGDWALISLRPFLSEESLIITMRNGDIFTILVTDSQIHKTVITASGEAWEITVTYDENAQIPDGAELKVQEIFLEDGTYQEYCVKASEIAGSEALKEGIEWPIVSGQRLFDIEISYENSSIEPAAPVQVDMRLQGKTADTLSVIHFAGDGPEVMSLRMLEISANEPRLSFNNGSDEISKDGGAWENGEKAYSIGKNDVEIVTSRVSFNTDSFSVYSVVTVTSGTNLENDGPWTLVTGVANDPGATTGYSETWGRDYFTIIVNANAMSDAPVISGGNEVAYVAEGVHAWTDGTSSYVGGDVPQVWNFEQVPNSNKYYIYVEKNGVKYYIDHHYGNQATTSLSTQWKTEFTIDRNPDGTISIHNGNWYLCNSGNGEWSNRDFRFSNESGIQNKEWARFRLCKESDGFEPYAAKKVSVQNLTSEDNFLIYRKFEDSEGNETLYALAHDGSFVRVYDGGDTVYWRETAKNIYWNYLDTGHGYSIFTKDPATNKPVFLYPIHSVSQTMSEESIGLTLLGKDTGEYGTAIENWDQPAYDYAGLHVTLNNGEAALSTGTRVAGTSDEFLFAVASSMPSVEAETVATVDSDSLGIKITMFDYGEASHEYNAGDKLPEMTAIAGSADYTPHAAHALVKPYLESGLPSGSNGAMTGLFQTGGAIKYSQTDVNHLFLQSYYDENGTFRYRSEDNYAYLGLNGNNDFTVYRQAATPYTTDKQPGHTYYYHGHFMPFNDIDMTQHVGRLMNQYGNAYDPNTGEIIGEISIGDGRTYEEIYGTKGIPNFYTGMKMEANFTQPRDGKLENGDEMIFKFTGDDDMWVYIDGILVLDIGGIHEPLSGSINFATGTVTNPTGSSLAGTTTLKQIFMNVRNADGTPQEVKDKIDSIVWDGDTFADYTNHSFGAFYMERGAGASNLDIQFNLKVVLTNQFTVQKEIPEDVDDRFDNQVYRFRATYMDGTTESGLHAGIENVCSAVVYRGTNDPVEVDNDGYFTLRAGEAAVFMMADESIRYNVREVDIDGNLIERVDINGQQVTVTDGTAEAGYAMVEERTQVSVMNHPKTQNLKITKHLTEDSAPLVEGENPVFEFRVYLETTVTNEDGTTQHQLVPYSYGPYYLVKEVDGALHYFTLTGVNNAPVDKGTEPVVCSTTGRSGSINSIPPEYTIIIPNLVIGTNFYVEERRDNIPEGYEFVREVLTPNTYDESTLIGEGASAEVIDRVLARDEADHQEFDPSTVGQIKSDVDAESHVFNRKPAVIITVEKEWDPDPESGTTVTVELRRYAKITKGTISVTLYDNNEAPIEGAEFELYKNGAATGTKVTTNVNGIASISGLEAGTYKLVQTSTPDGYSMDGHTTETGTLTVVDNVTAPQTLSESLTNTALVTAGKVTLTLTDSGAGSGTVGTPIEGAAFTLYKDGSAFKTGCVTNSEGKVIVGNLDAGEYYFDQTGTASDYYLPNVTRTEYFTVVENPGVTQEFNQSMANSLKGKGTVSLSLTKDSDDVISGASFQLKSGNTVLETKQTASDGTLSFSSELYEGTYTVHQVNTGSAGDDYATAGDQNVTIEANSMTTQQKSLKFVNEEALGTNTIQVYTGQGNINEWNAGSVESTLTKTGLKPGQKVSYSVTVSEYGEFAWYCTDYNPTTHTGSWQSLSDGTNTISYTIPSGSNGITYYLGIKYNWGMNNQGKVTLTGAPRSLNRINTLRTADGNRTLSAPMLRSTSGATRSVIHTNASPAAAPAGYAEDSTFEAIEITLPTNDGWQYTFDAQDKFDANGDPYYYYIVEKACSDPDYWIDSYTGDLLNDVGTITVKNVKEKTGSVQVKKSFSGVDALPAGFQITNTYNSEIFTVANASGSGTTEDPYVWTLSGIPSGTTVSFTESGATVNGYNLTVTSSGTVTADSTVAAIAVAGSTVTADLVNTYELKTTEITLKKVDKDDLNETNATLLKGAAFTLSKYESDSYQSKDLSWGTNGSKNLSDDKNPDGTYTLNGVFTFEGLTAGYYKIEETSFPAGYVKVSSDPTFKVEANASNELIITILNNPDNLLKLVDGEMTIVVGNTPGVALPSTGGPGTRLFTILGSILSLGAGVLLWRRRRLI